MFKPKIQPITIEDDGEKITLYVRQAAANEILDAESEQKDKSNKARIRHILATYVVSEDGKPVAAEVVDGMMAARVSAFKKISDAVVEKIGLNAVVKND